MELSLGWGNQGSSASKFRLQKSLPASALAKEGMETPPLPGAPVDMGVTRAIKYLTTSCIMLRACSEKPVSAELIPALPGFPLGQLWPHRLSPEGKHAFSSSAGRGVQWGPSAVEGNGWELPGVSTLDRLRRKLLGAGWEGGMGDKPFLRETQCNTPGIRSSAASQKCLPRSSNPSGGRCQHWCSSQGTLGSRSPRPWLRAGFLQEGKNRVGEQKLYSSSSFNSALMVSLPPEPLIPS